MLKNIALFAILALFIGVLAVNAQTAQDPAAPAKETKHTGKIDKIDTVAKTIAVKVEPSGEVRVFTFDDKTTFDSKGKTVKVDTLKAGDKVEIESDAANLAMKVSLMPMTEKDYK